MLEFIIALLLSLGFNVEGRSSLPKLDAATADLIRAEGRYEELGGNQEFQTFYIPASNGEDSIVPTIDPNPSN